MENKNELLYEKITEKIIGCGFEVYNELGYGYLEKVYENALMIAMQETGLKVEQQKPVPVYFREKLVGEYFTDILVEKKIIVEIKTIDMLSRIHFSQVLNYLKATRLKLGFLINFGPKKVSYERIIK